MWMKCWGHGQAGEGLCSDVSFSCNAFLTSANLSKVYFQSHCSHEAFPQLLLQLHVIFHLWKFLFPSVPLIWHSLSPPCKMIYSITLVSQHLNGKFVSVLLKNVLVFLFCVKSDMLYTRKMNKITLHTFTFICGINTVMKTQGCDQWKWKYSFTLEFLLRRWSFSWVLNEGKSQVCDFQAEGTVWKDSDVGVNLQWEMERLDYFCGSIVRRW